MKLFAIVSAVALVAGLPGIAAAQTSPRDKPPAAHQQSARDNWPADRQRTYEVWPADVKAYFWTLTPDEQAGWWLLTDEQRSQIHTMTPQQRAQAWVVIKRQLADGRIASASNAAQRGQGAEVIAWVSNPVVQQIASNGAVYRDGKVPICDENEFDDCMNAWEAGKRGPGVERPLDYWPGHR